MRGTFACLPAVALVALQLACGSWNAQPPVAGASNPPSLILEDHFDNQETDWWLDWTGDGVARVGDGKLQLSIPDPDSDAITGHTRLDYLSPPYELKALLTPVSGSGNSLIAIAFRYLDDDNLAVLFLGANGLISLSVTMDGEYRDIIPWTTQPGSFAAGARVRLVDTGKRLSFTANDELVFDMPFEFLRAGGLYFYVGAFDKLGASWEIDDVLVSSAAP